MVDVDELKKMGYEKDYYGHDLESSDQLIELMLQDIILPLETAEHLLRVSKYIDDELVFLYNLEPFYKAKTVHDLIGQMIVGLAPHTSVGILGRIIGFTRVIWKKLKLGSVPVFSGRKSAMTPGISLIGI